MMNIRLHYLYRDGANYKNYHSEVFSNSYCISVSAIADAIISSLIDGQWFVAKEWKLKDLHFSDWDEEIDHGWHEYDSVVETEDEPTQTDVAVFLELIVNR